MAVRDKIKGDFVVIPKSTIKSDEPIFIDGMAYDDLKAEFKVPVHDADTADFIKILSN